MARRLLDEYGAFVGGSTATVLCAVKRLSERFRPGEQIVAISPDFGDKYLNTIFNQEWSEANLP